MARLRDFDSVIDTVRTIATATEELPASVSEIARSASDGGAHHERGGRLRGVDTRDGREARRRDLGDRLRS